MISQLCLLAQLQQSKSTCPFCFGKRFFHFLLTAFLVSFNGYFQNFCTPAANSSCSFVFLMYALKQTKGTRNFYHNFSFSSKNAVIPQCKDISQNRNKVACVILYVSM